MKTKLQKIVFLAFALLVSYTSMSATNTNPILDPQFFGFEMGDPDGAANGSGTVSGVYFQHAPQWAFSSAQATTGGTKSLKLEVTNPGTDYSAQIGNANFPDGSKVTCDAGVYNVSIKVFVISAPSASIVFNLGGAAVGSYTNPFKSILIPLGDVATDETKWNQWQTITTQVTLTDNYYKSKSVLKSGSAVRPATGTTLMYFDDLTMTYIGTDTTTASISTANMLDGNAYISSNSLIVNSTDGCNLQMFSMAGIEVLSANNITAKYSTSVSHLNSGLYLVKVTNNGISFVQKVSVK